VKKRTKNQMTETLIIWLAKHFNVKEEQIKKDINFENVAGFLIIWTIFEQKAFEGYMAYKEIKKFADKNAAAITNEIRKIAESFHDRYQDSTKYKKLRHGDNHDDVKNILKKQKEELTDNEKMQLALYVLYRYRNNIFHGNKGARSWSEYHDQIDQCVRIMAFVIDNNLTSLSSERNN